MRQLAYFQIDGPEFQAAQFAGQKGIGGEVVKPKRNRFDPTKEPVEFWRGDFVSIEPSTEHAVLLGLTSAMKPFVDMARSCGASNILLVEFVECTVEDVRGVHVSADVVAQLALLGASFDFDIHIQDVQVE